MTMEKSQALAIKEWSLEEKELVKNTVAKGATDLELKLFFWTANKRGLDPLLGQIHFIKRKRFDADTEKTEEIGTIQTGIDGFRVIADRTGKLDGIKREALLDEEGRLVGARATVWRKDWAQPIIEEVSFEEYCQKRRDGKPMRMWATMPITMIKKVAEAVALRIAFPEDLSGLYAQEEMEQAGNEPSSEKLPPNITTITFPKPLQASNAISENQRKRIFALAKEKGLNTERLHSYIAGNFLVSHITELSGSQATELIEKLLDMESVQQESSPRVPDAQKKGIADETGSEEPELGESAVTAGIIEGKHSPLVTDEDISHLRAEMRNARWDDIRLQKYVRDKGWTAKRLSSLTVAQLEEAIRDIIADGAK